MITLDLINDLTEAIKRVNHTDKASSATVYKYALLEQVDSKTLELTTYTKNLGAVTQKIRSTATVVGTAYLVLFQDLEKLCSRFSSSDYSCQLKQTSNGLTLSTFATANADNIPIVLDTVVLSQYHGTIGEFPRATRESRKIAVVKETVMRNILTCLKQYGKYTTSPRTIVIKLDSEAQTITFYGNHAEGRNYIIKLETESQVLETDGEPRKYLFVDGGYIDAFLDTVSKGQEEEDVVLSNDEDSERLTFQGSMGLVTIDLNDAVKETIAATWRDFFSVGEIVGHRQTEMSRCMKAVQAQQPTTLYNNKMLQLTKDEDPTKLTISKVGDTKKIEQSILYVTLTMDKELGNDWLDIAVGSRALLDTLTMLDRFKAENTFENEVVFLLHKRSSKKRGKVRNKYLLRMNTVDMEGSAVRVDVAAIVNLVK